MNMFGGMGGGAGGMPNLAAMMQNPAIMQMAQSLMGGGGFDELMRNPTMANMVRDFCTLIDSSSLCVFIYAGQSDAERGHALEGRTVSRPYSPRSVSTKYDSVSVHSDESFPGIAEPLSLVQAGQVQAQGEHEDHVACR